MSPAPVPVSLAPIAPDDPRAQAILRAYMTDVVGRYHGRAATRAEVDAALAAEPSDDLREPTGVLLAAVGADAVLGCGGLRWVSGDVAELTRLYVTPAARRHGLGAQLLDALQMRARARGAGQLRLDTRSDLVEALALYAAAGFAAVPAFGHAAHSDVWLAKGL